ncbi:hypothetical protein MCEMSE15_01650 [Fimbriimonadaceae bacterium]
MIRSLKSQLPARKVAVLSNVGALLIFSRLLCLLFVFVDLPLTHPSVEFAVAGMYLLLAVLLFFTLRSTFLEGDQQVWIITCGLLLVVHPLLVFKWVGRRFSSS